VRRHDDPLVPFDRNDLRARRPRRIRQRVRHRTRSRAARLFSDAVFAIAVTLLVLEVRPPEDTRHLLHGLAALWPSYLSYAISFLLIGQGGKTGAVSVLGNLGFTIRPRRPAS
jgi:hypothetical protein